VGGSLQGVHSVEARAEGAPIQILVNGQVAEEVEPGQIVRIPVEEGRCSVIRARVGQGFSAPVYANCPFAG
jgi:hypothetical protein